MLIFSLGLPLVFHMLKLAQQHGGIHTHTQPHIHTHTHNTHTRTTPAVLAVRGNDVTLPGSARVLSRARHKLAAHPSARTQTVGPLWWAHSWYVLPRVVRVWFWFSAPACCMFRSDRLPLSSCFPLVLSRFGPQKCMLATVVALLVCSLSPPSPSSSSSFSPLFAQIFTRVRDGA